jgi:hypothetical protein
MKISHIVTNGCSFTYCQGLPNMIVNGWPAQVANTFNCPVVNLGVPGVGNDSIFRRTSEYIYENQLRDDHKPLVIIEWTQRWRREVWSNKEEDYIMVSFPDDKVTDKDYNQLSLLENWNDEDFIRKTILYRLSLINILENLEIPYLMFNYAGNEEAYDKEHKVTRYFSNMTNKSRNQCDIGDLYHFTGSMPKLPCGHDDIEGQNFLGKYISDKIKEIYPNLEYTNTAKFLSLHDYIKTSKYHRKFPEWCNFKLKDDILP